MLNEKYYKLGSNRSMIREIFEYGLQRAKVVGKENIYDFSLGNPTVPVPQEVNEAIMDLLTAENTSSVHGYTSAQGDENVRQAIAEYLNQTYELSFHKDNLYMTCGAAASLSITLHALTESETDEFIAIAPFFPEYRVFVNEAGANLTVVQPDYDKFQIDWNLLNESINEHTKGIIINSPNNPSGVIYSEATIIKLCEILRNKEKDFGHTITLIADEPYREITYGDTDIPYLTKYYSNTIVCYSYSKSLSLPGDRIGYIIVPDNYCESKKMYLTICGAGRSMGYVCAPNFFQKVIQKCIGVTADINIYKENRDLLYQELTNMGYTCIYPEGAFYLFVKALESDAVEFCNKAKEKDILFVPGDEFGCPGYVRISYCVDKKMIERSLAKFQELANEYLE